MNNETNFIEGIHIFKFCGERGNAPKLKKVADELNVKLTSKGLMIEEQIDFSYLDIF